MIGHKSVYEARTKAIGTVTDYLVLFVPGMWKDASEQIKLRLRHEVDWEAFNGHTLHYYDEKDIQDKDRVDVLQRIERMSVALRELRDAVSPVDWYFKLDNVLHAAMFRVAKHEASMEQDSVEKQDK